MAIGIYFAPTSMTVAQYDEIVQRLKKAGAGHPKGRRYHACFGDADKLQVFDVWDSQATFDKFGQTLMPILEEGGEARGPQAGARDEGEGRQDASRQEIGHPDQTIATAPVAGRREPAAL